MFCNKWAYNPKWEYVEDITGCEDPYGKMAVSQAFAALGYECEMFGENEMKAHLLHYQKRITDSIDKGLPVFTYGIVGHPCCSLITGYDENGDVLIGWSKFQNEQDLDNLPDGFEECGYFRKRKGLLNSHGLIFFGEKIQRQDIKDIFIKAIENSVAVADLKKTDKYVYGYEAYTYWADALECDEDFPENDMDILLNRLDVHSGPLLITLTGRFYANSFLSYAAKFVPEWKPEIEKAMVSFNEEQKILFGIMKIQGGFANSDPKIAKKLSEPKIRREIANIIRNARDINARAVEHLRNCIKIG